MWKKERQMNISKIYQLLRKQTKDYVIPIAETQKTPFKTLIGTILSARTLDTTTAKVCKVLFKKVNSFKDLKKISQKELEKIIKPIGFYKTKARNLKKLAEVTNKVPNTMEELLKLPGVGRKTANLVLSLVHNKQTICVDTHVHRISNRLGLIKTKTPHQTELALIKILPKKYWSDTNHLLVKHGQNTCRPISPKCPKCALKPVCKYYKEIYKK